MARAPVISVCHGGGPMPLLNDPGHKDLIQSMTTKLPKVLGLGTDAAPKAIVLVTAHWSERVPTISSGKTPKLLYDYGGFPPESYQIKYDAPGSPEIAKLVADTLRGAGFQPELNEERGWDHGVFVPMKLINPAANIPIIQLAVLASMSAPSHFALGRALAPLRDQNIAILGSGMPSFHNLRLMFSGEISKPAFLARNKEWSEKLTETMGIVGEEERGKALERWREWTGAWEAHPKGGEEHFMPLVVCAGAAGGGRVETIKDEVLGTEQVTYYWK